MIKCNQKWKPDYDGLNYMKRPMMLNLFAADAAFPDQPWKNGSGGIESSGKKVSKAWVTGRVSFLKGK